MLNLLVRELEKLGNYVGDLNTLSLITLLSSLYSKPDKSFFL